MYMRNEGYPSTRPSQKSQYFEKSFGGKYRIGIPTPLHYNATLIQKWLGVGSGTLVTCDTM